MNVQEMLKQQRYYFNMVHIQMSHHLETRQNFPLCALARVREESDKIVFEIIYENRESKC